MGSKSMEPGGATAPMSADEARSVIKTIVAVSDSDPSDTALLMVRRYALGASLERVGTSLGVSRERVRQVINSTEWPMPVLKEARSVLEKKNRDDTARAAERLVLQWSSDHPGEPIEQAIRDLGMPMTVISRALGSRRALHRPAAEAPARNQRWTDEDLIGLLKQFYAETGSTVSQEFEKWSLAHGGPTRQTPINRFGKWYSALAAAGISEQSYSVDRERRHSEDDLWAAVIEFFSEKRDGYSFNAFTRWLASVPDLPSASLVRVRLGLPWAELSRTAQRVLSGRTDGLDPDWVRSIRRPRDWSSITTERPDPVAIVRRAVPEIGPVMTMVEYSRWAAENGSPPANTLIQRAGVPWSVLVAKAGGRVGTRGRRGSIPDDELLEPLVLYLNEGRMSDYERYSEWARRDRRPVAGTIAARFGGWDSAVRQARAAIDAGRLGVDPPTRREASERAGEEPRSSASESGSRAAAE